MVLHGFVFAAALAALSLAAIAQGRAEELMRKSGLWDQVAQMRVQMKAGVAEARAQAKAAGQSLLTDEQTARLMSAIDRTFAPLPRRGIKAIDNTISQAALALGQDLGEAMRERRNQS